MCVGWRNCRNELDGVRASAAVSEHALALERAAHSDTLASRDDAYDRVSLTINYSLLLCTSHPNPFSRFDLIDLKAYKTRTRKFLLWMRNSRGSFLKSPGLLVH